MYPFHQYGQPYQQYFSQGTAPSLYQYDQVGQIQLPSSASMSITRQCNLINQRATVISSEELTRILDKLFKEVNKSHNEKERIANLNDIIVVLIRIRRSILTSVVEHKFFTLLKIPLNQILLKWNLTLHLNKDDRIIFRNAIQLLRGLFHEITDFKLYPSWLTDPSLLNTISICLTDISKSTTYFHKKNTHIAKNFIRLFDIYSNYQKLSNDQDKLISLLDPVIQCLTSNIYLDSFDRIEKGATLKSKQEKFFLTRCPTFLTAYNGSRLQSTMTDLLSKMLPKYTIILDTLMPSVHQWKHRIIRAIIHLLQIVNHGSINPNILSTHLSFIDYVLNIIDVPIFYNNLQETLINLETDLINTAVSLLANFITEPTILTHIKQKKVTSSFLRLTSAKYKPLVYHIYTLLAYTTSEDDIKSMENPGILLSTVVNGLKTEIDKESNNQDQVVQLIETLKGLVQHDQLKEEILKQNIHISLLQYMNKLLPEGLTLLLETFWSLSFAPSLATVLRNNPALVEKVQTISNNSNDEALKKAADGLVWKLIREPAFLDKVAKEENANNETSVIIGADGKKQIVTTTKKGANAQVERVFQYDIMISYCHADKELIKKIHKFLLDEGFKVWIDLDNMFGPAMNAMADAVENSEFVLLCMSDSYKQSTYCQAEAEYAFGCKRRLVPLIVRQGYRADGWLGFMIGSRIYVDFGSFDFETACDKLIIEIVRQRQRPLPVKAAKAPKSANTTINTSEISNENSTLFTQKLPTPYTKRKTTLEFNQKYIDQWTESDVLDFLYSHQLNELMPLCEKMNGPSLIQLHKMCLSKYQQTYKILNNQLKITYQIILPIGVYTKFLNIMERVITAPMKFTLPSLPPPVYLPPLTYQPPLAIEPPRENNNSGYDIVITSNIPPLKLLEMVERKGSQWKLKNFLQS